MNAGLARFIHSTRVRLGTPAALLRWWWRNRRDGGAGLRVGERLAIGGIRAAPGALWLHADTADQAQVADALIASLRQLVPDLHLLLTHRSRDARAAVGGKLRAGDCQVWLPLDTPGAARRFFRSHRPAVGVMLQHAVGPNLADQARRAGVPLVLADARLADARLAAPQAAVRGLAAALRRQVLAGLDTVLAQTSTDAQHLRDAGASRVKVTGGVAFDHTPPARRLARGLLWRQALSRPVILAAGTCEGEEAALLRAWLMQRSPRPLLVIVPRDARRFDDVAALIGGAGWSLLRRSSFVEAPPAEAAQVDVWLGDTTGEWPTYYGAADVALLGGSFTSGVGPQDLIEACACGCPGVIGPFTAGSERAMTELLVAGAARRADDLTEAVALAVAIAGDGNRNEWVQRAFAFARSHRGAADRTADEVMRIFNERGSVRH